MSTPGDERRAARRAARADEPKPQATDLTPIEEAIKRKLAQLAKKEATPDVDARAIATIVVKHWGDDAPRVLQLALEHARDEVGHS